MAEKAKAGVLLQRIGGLVLGIAIIAYSIYHVVSLFGEDISTITTGISTEKTVLDGKGYIFRDEIVLYSDNYGVADYFKKDGAKVSVGEALADVGENGSDASKSMVGYFDKKIAILEQSVSSGKTLADLPEINSNISDAYYSLAKALASGDTGSISAQADKLLLNMNCHSIITDENTPVDNTYTEMTERRTNLLTAGGESITEYASDSGYFYSYADGYEEYFTTDAADNLTARTFYSLTEDKKPSTLATTQAYGKLASNSEWRFVIKMSSVSTQYFKEDNIYRFNFIENGNATIPMRLTQIVEDDVYGGNLLVFYADRLPEDFVFDRCQSVSIEVSSFSGIYVPKTAVHKVGGEYCVYVLRGSVVTLRSIDIVYETMDYYLSNPDVEYDGGVPYLDANELLIVKGSNLF
ncbi:MAG: hypothetical protein J6U86_03455, partial [Clostridia bacterium]|nr:hypothetical protein [Clostridia bacterium]